MKARIDDLEFECTVGELFELLRLRCEHIEHTSPDWPDDVSLERNTKEPCKEREKFDSSIVSNKRFREGKKLYQVWFNDQEGRFLVLDKEFHRHDIHSIMICGSWDEANNLACALNVSITHNVNLRKEMIRLMEKGSCNES